MYTQMLTSPKQIYVVPVILSAVTSIWPPRQQFGPQVKHLAHVDLKVSQQNIFLYVFNL